jgi:hypothetical protein
MAAARHTGFLLGLYGLRLPCRRGASWQSMKRIDVWSAAVREPALHHRFVPGSRPGHDRSQRQSARSDRSPNGDQRRS